MSTVLRFADRSSWDVSLILENEGVEGQGLSPTALNPSNLALTPTGDVPVSLYMADTMVGNSGTPTFNIDLTAFADVEGRTKTALGKKVQAVRIQAGADNAGDVTVEGGATNAYDLFGVGNAVDVPPGGMIGMRLNDQAPDVAAGAKNIKVTLGHGDTVSVELVMG
jgi:hypothetical protein